MAVELRIESPSDTTDIHIATEGGEVGALKWILPLQVFQALVAKVHDEYQPAGTPPRVEREAKYLAEVAALNESVTSLQHQLDKARQAESAKVGQLGFLATHDRQIIRELAALLRDLD